MRSRKTQEKLVNILAVSKKAKMRSRKVGKHSGIASKKLYIVNILTEASKEVTKRWNQSGSVKGG